jgi:hypothetical protein
MIFFFEVLNRRKQQIECCEKKMIGLAFRQRPWGRSNRFPSSEGRKMLSSNSKR